MNENDMMQDDEISLYELWEKLRDGWRVVVGGAVLGALAALVAILLAKPVYQATTIVQVARVGGNAVEPVATTVERIKSPAFLKEIALKSGDAGLIDRAENNAAAAADLGVASLVKGTELFQLTNKGDSPESARRLASLSVAALVSRHDELAAALLRKVESDIAALRDKLVVAEREQAELTRATASVNVKDANFAPVSLLTSLRLQKQSDVLALRQRMTELELSLIAPATQPTRPLEETYVGGKPASPKKALLLVLGGIGGLLAGVILVFFMDAWRRAKGERRRAAS